MTAAQTQPAVESPTLSHLYQTEYRRKRLRHAAASTHTRYKVTLRGLDKFLGHTATTADLKDDTIADYLAWLVQHGKSPFYANSQRNHLLALWRFIARKRLVEEFPDVERVPEPEKIPQAWSADELARLFASAKRQLGTIAGIPAGPWWFALLSLLWDTGERIGAVLKIEWHQIDLAGGWLTVPAEHRKFGRKGKVFKLGAETLAALRDIQQPTRAVVFAWDRNPTYLWTCFNEVLCGAGLPNDRRSKFHRMRRSTASHFEAAGGNATDLLGHSMRRVTEAYLDPRIVRKQQAADVLFRPAHAEVEAPAAVTTVAADAPDDSPIAGLIGEYHAATAGKHKWASQAVYLLRHVLRLANVTTLGELSAETILAAIEGHAKTMVTADKYRKGVLTFVRWLVRTKGMGGSVLTCAQELSAADNPALSERLAEGVLRVRAKQKPRLPRERIREAMQRAGLSEHQLAKAIGLSRGHLSNVLLGKRPVGANLDKALRRVLKLSRGG
ncbi:MAG: tyrosine-type recombinase/integrase [Pirellulales bacterium]